MSTVSSRHGDVSVLERTSPAPVFHLGELWVFYMDSGGEGIFYVRRDRDSWSPVKRTNDDDALRNLTVAWATSPSAVYFNKKVHLFYNGSGQYGGTEYTTLSGGYDWSPIVYLRGQVGGTDSQQFQPETSPNATVFKKKLYLFWNSGTGVWYSTLKGGQWETQARVETVEGVAKGTSPFAVSFNDSLYLFWNGSGNDGTYFSTFDGVTWDKQTSMRDKIGSSGFLPGTSPSAVVLKRNLLRVFWVGSGGNSQSFWYSDYDTKTDVWNGQRNWADEFGGNDLGDGSNPVANIYDRFWAENHRMYTSGEDTDDSVYYSDPMDEFRERRTFYVLWKGQGTDLLYSQLKSRKGGGYRQ